MKLNLLFLIVVLFSTVCLHIFFRMLSSWILKPLAAATVLPMNKMQFMYTSRTSLSLTAMYYQVLRQPLNYVIVNLAAADFLAGVVGGFVSIFANANGYFFWGKWMCQFEGYMVSNFGKVKLSFVNKR